MPAKQEEKQQAVRENLDHQKRDAALGDRVIHTLGQPPALHRVQVRRLWADYYRVNVFVGVDAASTRVAHSYFLTADGDGNITACDPKLLKQY